MRKIVWASLVLVTASVGGAMAASPPMASEWHTVARDAVGCYEHVGPGDACIKFHAGDQVLVTRPVAPGDAFALVRFHGQPLMIRSNDLAPQVASR